MGKNKKTVFKTDWFEIETEEYDFPPQYRGKPFYRMNVGESVLVCAVTDDRKIVFVRQFRPSWDDYLIELPAGGVDMGEEARVAAAREFYEETGYSCKNLEFVSHCILSASRIRGAIHLFFGRDAKKDPQFTSQEGSEAVLLSIDDLRGLAQSGNVNLISALGAILLVKWVLNPPELSSLEK